MSFWGRESAAHSFCLWLAGNGGSGRLGTGTNTSVTAPAPVKAPAGVSNWIRISAGEEHTCAIAGTGWAYCMGAASFGRLGRGESISDSEVVPQPVSGVDGVEAWIDITAGDSHRCERAKLGSARRCGHQRRDSADD